MAKYEDFWFDIYGKKEPNEDAMIVHLMLRGVLVPSCQKYTNCVGQQSTTITLHILANDIFGPGSDAEDVTLDELPKLFEMHWKHGYEGVVKFIADKRGIKYEMKESTNENT